MKYTEKDYIMVAEHLDDIDMRNKLLESHIPFIIFWLKEHRIKVTNELINEGFLGLVRAYEKYDWNHESGAKFLSYGVYWIKGFVLNYLKKQNQEKAFSIKEYYATISETGSENYKDRNFDFIDNNQPTPEEYYLEKNLSALVRSVTSRLEKKEDFILTEYFGLGTDSKSLKWIGNKISLTRERTRQIKNKAVRKLFRSKSLRELWYEEDRSDKDDCKIFHKQKKLYGFDVVITSRHLYKGILFEARIGTLGHLGTYYKCLYRNKRDQMAIGTGITESHAIKNLFKKANGFVCDGKLIVDRNTIQEFVV